MTPRSIGAIFHRADRRIVGQPLQERRRSGRSGYRQRNRPARVPAGRAAMAERRFASICAHRRQHRQPQTQRQHHRRCRLPGPPMAPRASRSATRAPQGWRRQPARPAPQPRRPAPAPPAPPTTPPAVPSASSGTPKTRRPPPISSRHQPGQHQQIHGPRPACRATPAPVQRRRPHRLGPRQRPQREDQRGQRPVKRRLGQRLGIKRESAGTGNGAAIGAEGDQAASPDQATPAPIQRMPSSVSAPICSR